jgi:8-oxo-dGTP diphosphatase
MAKRERFKLSLSVFLFLIQDNSVLLIKRSNTGWMDGYYSVPAGALDGNENLVQAVIREAKEEVNVTVAKKDVQLVHTMHNMTHGEEWIGAFFVAHKWKGIPKVNEPEKHSEVKWVSIDSLPDNVIPYVKQAINAHRKNQFYSEFGWEDIRVKV